MAGQGEISLPLTIAIAWSCAWAGDSVSFLIGTRLARRVDPGRARILALAIASAGGVLAVVRGVGALVG